MTCRLSARGCSVRGVTGALSADGCLPAGGGWLELFGNRRVGGGRDLGGRQGAGGFEHLRLAECAAGVAGFEADVSDSVLCGVD